jgi:hypothetical protein
LWAEQRSRRFAVMRVDVVESLSVQDKVGWPAVEDAGTERALRSFFAAIESDDSLFTCEAPRTWLGDGSLADGASVVWCSGDFVLRFRGESLSGNRRLHFSLLEKLVELLKAAGSAEWLLAHMCLTSDSGEEANPAGLALRLRLEAQGNSSEQAALRWGLGVAHVQQALLFTSRYLRQQIGQSAD